MANDAGDISKLLSAKLQVKLKLDGHNKVPELETGRRRNQQVHRVKISYTAIESESRHYAEEHNRYPKASTENTCYQKGKQMHHVMHIKYSSISLKDGKN